MVVPSRPLACLFDLDGLLLDTEPLHSRGWSDAAAHFGGTLNSEQLQQLKGRRRHDCARQVSAWLPEPVDPDTLLAVQQPIVRQLLPEARAMPGAEALVQYCHQAGIAMALVTSSAEKSVLFKSAPHPWLTQIGMRVYGDDPELSAGKPDPAPFQLGAARLGIPVDRCWALEDSQAGTASALAAGCQVWTLNESLTTSEIDGNPARINSLEVVLETLISTGD